MKKRTLVWILSTCMLILAMPSAVFAANITTKESLTVAEEATDGSVNNAETYVISLNTTWESKNYTGTVYISRGVELTTTGTNVINGDVYVFGTLTNTGDLTVNGTIYCLSAYGGMFSAGNYDYGIFNNTGSLEVTELHVRDDYLNTQISDDNDHNTEKDRNDTGKSSASTDITAPVLSDIQILENGKTLKVGDTFHVTAKATDNESGVASVTAFYDGPTSGSGGVLEFQYNSSTDLYEASHTFTEKDVAGEYKISAIWGEDKVGNSSSWYHPTDIVKLGNGSEEIDVTGITISPEEIALHFAPLDGH